MHTRVLEVEGPWFRRFQCLSFEVQGAISVQRRASFLQDLPDNTLPTHKAHTSLHSDAVSLLDTTCGGHRASATTVLTAARLETGSLCAVPQTLRASSEPRYISSDDTQGLLVSMSVGRLSA